LSTGIFQEGENKEKEILGRNGLVAWPGLDEAKTEAEYNRKMDRLPQYAAQAKLPAPSRPRSFAREIRGRGALSIP
jgi:hypothetical protein